MTADAAPLRDVEARIADLLDAPVTRLVSADGGDLSDVRFARLEDGRDVVAKFGADMRAEAAMLAAISAAGCPAPLVLAVEDDVLLLERLPIGLASAEGWSEAGAAIARLHGAVGPHYGWSEGTGFGFVRAPAEPAAPWPTFWAESRLLAWPENLDRALARRLERLAADIGNRLPQAPQPSLLHGDLWSGNLLFQGGFSGVIDPACYWGDAEVDLAMLTLFDEPPAPFWRAYGALPDGWRERRVIYQIWPSLVHLRLFGDSFRSLVESRLVAAGV